MKASRIRVLHIVHDFHYGGLERLIAEMVKRLDPARFETHILSLTTLGGCAAGLQEFATLHKASPMSRWSMISPRALAADIRRISPDVAHIHSGVWFKASQAAKLAGVTHQLYTDHGRQNPDPWINRALDRRASARSDAVVAVSEPLRDQMMAFVSHPDRIRVIANGVDTTRYCPRPGMHDLRDELGVSDESSLIGSVGRLEPIKGYEVMVAAYGQLVQAWEGEHVPALVLIGDGSERAALEEQIAHLPPAACVHLLGWRNDIEKYLPQFTVFSISSWSEGTSISLLESMSCAVCPIVTDVGGNRIVLGPDLARHLVPPGNAHALAAAWRRVLGDSRQLERDGATSRQRIIELFDLEGTVRAYEDLYTELHRGLLTVGSGYPRARSADTGIA